MKISGWPSAVREPGTAARLVGGVWVVSQQPVLSAVGQAGLPAE